jgi:hypothetical protein
MLQYPRKKIIVNNALICLSQTNLKVEIHYLYTWSAQSGLNPRHSWIRPTCSHQ